MVNASAYAALAVTFLPMAGGLIIASIVRRTLGGRGGICGTLIGSAASWRPAAS